MFGFLIAFFVLWIVIWPLLTLLHELGHALAALSLTEGPVRIELGSDSPARSFRIGRLTVTLRFATGFVGFYRHPSRPARAWQQVAICVAGPQVSLLCACLATWLLLQVPGISGWARTLLVWTGGFAAVQFLVTIIPFRYPSW